MQVMGTPTLATLDQNMAWETSLYRQNYCDLGQVAGDNGVTTGNWVMNTPVTRIQEVWRAFRELTKAALDCGYPILMTWSAVGIQPPIDFSSETSADGYRWDRCNGWKDLVQHPGADRN